MKVMWTPHARRDLLHIREHIEQDSREIAARIAGRLRASAKRLSVHPEMGRAGRVGSTRELVVPGTPYVLPYRVRRTHVEILAVIHGAMEWVGK